MDFIKTEHEILQNIIDTDGNCLSSTNCKHCPFADKCLGMAITKARRLLPRISRVRLAYERLFNKLMEDELDS
jgi:hypothetical protein